MTLPSRANLDPDPQDGDIYEPLPQQEQFYRAPARFGSIPVEAEPKGWDRREGFRKLYPRIDLPTQIIERVALGHNSPHQPNRLIWGDNLHIMRQLPTNSIDLIYIDPPFFSGRQYNVIWGDNNELRSFNDIWESGLDGYLIWLNARLYEMKRLLKPTGSIYVHCDWHASHYIKVEMDRIFGYANFVNEVFWKRYAVHSLSNSGFDNATDSILIYAVDGSAMAFNKVYGATEQSELEKRFPHIESETGRRYQHAALEKSSNSYSAGETRVIDGREVKGTIGWIWTQETFDRRIADNPHLIYWTRNGRPRYKIYADEYAGAPLGTMWVDVPYLSAGDSERIGYPTQKPERLLERIIKASSNEGDVVADFFVGGGTTAVVAQRLNRPFIVSDQSRVAVSVTAERLKQAAVTRGVADVPIPDFTVEQWGIYDAKELAAMPADPFRRFVLQSYGATRIAAAEGPDIHGWRNQLPIWVGAPALDFQATAAEVRAFANAIRRTDQYRQANLRDGVMLAWGFRPDARAAADQLREQESIDVNFVRLKQVRIGDADFREHIIGRSTDKADYGEFLTFIQPPEVNVGWRVLGGGSVAFDAGDTAVINLGAEIVNVQWDFAYDGRRFNATPGYSFQREGSGGKKKPVMTATHRFAGPGRRRVACRVQDSRGGEGFWAGELEVK